MWSLTLPQLCVTSKMHFLQLTALNCQDLSTFHDGLIYERAFTYWYLASREIEREENRSSLKSIKKVCCSPLYIV